MSTKQKSPSKASLKENLCSAIDRHADAIVGIGEQIMAQPELGFKEHATAKRVTDTMRAFGLEPETGLALTGVKARLRSGRPGPTVVLIGEQMHWWSPTTLWQHRQPAPRTPVVTTLR